MNTYTLITGASSGIGLEFAKTCARNNHNLILVARQTDKLLELKAQIQKPGIDIKVMPMDLSQVNAAQELYAKIQSEELEVSILINNAGFGNYGAFETNEWSKEAELLQVNIVCLSQLTKLVLPAMTKNKYGRILNVASTAAFFPGPFMATYYASKAYVLSFSEALASELQDSGVTVTCLCPGPTTTGFQKNAHAEGIKLFKNKATLATAKQVAEYGFNAMEKGKRIAVYGTLNKLTTFSARIMPRYVMAELVKKIQS